MNILIVGCGKSGARLAKDFYDEGHDVSILDRNKGAFDALPNGFDGFTTSGVPIDQDVLKKAGIETADVLVALTQDDNVNIMVAQVAKEIFHVPKVLIRVFDPRRGTVFSHYNLRTVCPTSLTVAAIKAQLADTNGAITNVNLGTHSISFETIDIPKEYIGKYVSEIPFDENEVLYAVQRAEKLLLMSLKNIELLKGDKLIFSKIID